MGYWRRDDLGNVEMLKKLKLKNFSKNYIKILQKFTKAIFLLYYAKYYSWKVYSYEIVVKLLSLFFIIAIIR